MELENVQLEGIKSIKFYVVCSQFEMKNKLLIGSSKETKSKSLAYFTFFYYFDDDDNDDKFVHHYTSSKAFLELRSMTHFRLHFLLR